MHPSEQNHGHFQSQGCLVGPMCWRVNSLPLPDESAERTRIDLSEDLTEGLLSREAQCRVPVGGGCRKGEREEARGQEGLGYPRVLLDLLHIETPSQAIPVGDHGEAKETDTRADSRGLVLLCSFFFPLSEMR